VIALAVALTTLGAAPAVDVVVLSKHAPKQARWSKARCKVAGVRVDRVRAVEGGLSLCAGKRCRASAAPRLEVRCDGPAQVTIEAVEPRTYGARFVVSEAQGHLRIVARVEEARYVEGVVASELAGAPEAAQRAQAVLARTYVREAVRHPRHADAPVCDLTHCQVFREARDLGLGESRHLVGPDGQPTPVFFHSTCGGQTHPASEVWPGAPAHLVGVEDVDPETGRAWCAAGEHARWVIEIGAARLAAALEPLFGRAPDPESLALQALDPSGTRWRLSDRRGEAEVSGRALHRELGRRLGWSTVKSSRFEAARAGRAFRLRGQGLGHAVGLCQVGAIARARAGHTVEQILQAYFPKLRLTK